MYQCFKHLWIFEVQGEQILLPQMRRATAGWTDELGDGRPDFLILKKVEWKFD